MTIATKAAFPAMCDSNDPAQHGEEQHSCSTSCGLLERVKADEQDAWRRLVELYAPLVYRWCRRSDLPDQDAADVLQEVFQAVASHIAGFRKEAPGDTFRGWLHTITQNKLRDHFRRRGRQPAAEGGTEAQLRFLELAAASYSGAAETDEARTDSGLLSRALSLIRHEFQTHTWRAFWLIVVEGQSPDEVCAALRMSPGAVRVAKSRVLRRLRQELGELP
jgi:RNA polymerase sigma-70 factor, ECF subfamily